MLFSSSVVSSMLLLASSSSTTHAFVTIPRQQQQQQQLTTTTATTTTKSSSSSSFLNMAPAVSIGLGPGEEETTTTSRQDSMKAGVDYEIPNHEEYRTSRRSKLDEQCDAWFTKLLYNNDNNDNKLVQCGILNGPITDAVLSQLTTPVELTNDHELPQDDENYTPFVNTKLPWTPLVPAFGLEQYGLPIPRRNAETWRHFDVPNMIAQDYSQTATTAATATTASSGISSSKYTTDEIQKQLQDAGVWMEINDNDDLTARLVYVNGVFVPELSHECTMACNLNVAHLDNEDVVDKLQRLTDGFTDALVAPVDQGDDDDPLTSFAELSKPNHNLGKATSQFAINSQQGTACFTALNTLKTQAVAYVHTKQQQDEQEGKNNNVKQDNTVLIINAVTDDYCSSDSNDNSDKGVTLHPRTLVIAEQQDSHLSIIQNNVEIGGGGGDKVEGDAAAAVKAVPKLYNGYTQIFIEGNVNVTHSYISEQGSMPVGGIEGGVMVDNIDTDKLREQESARPAMKDTVMEAIDTHVNGGVYTGTVIAVPGSGRSRIAQSVTLLKEGSECHIKGFSLSGGLQRSDIKTNIHHIADGCASTQLQKNMVGGRATSSFRGRIRVEQSAQQTESQQLSRTVLLSDRARAWAVPSLEIIADDVQCTHGATVSDLSEEELFYLRSRGLDPQTSRNLLMYAFCQDVTESLDPKLLKAEDKNNLPKRIVQKLENVVPRGKRAVQGEFQSI